MSIEDYQIIDLIGIDKDSNECVLTISDHLDWEESNHMLLLQEKLNNYLAFIESGEIVDTYPDSKDKNIRIDLVLKHATKDYNLIDKIKLQLEKLGFRFRVEVLNL